MRGVYLLLIRVEKSVKIKVGKLGLIDFERGEYVYVGSDQRNLEKRIRRHSAKNKKKKWHIDYLTANENVATVAAYAYDLPKEYECKIAKEVSTISSKIIKGFGSSDCRCPSHFFKIDRGFNELISKISNRIKKAPILKMRFV